VLAPLDTQLEDEDLLAQLRAGDEAAFRALVDRHRPWLVRLCTRLLGDDAHAAEDAAQESLLKLHAVARRDARPLRVRAWLTVVARNTCIDEQRRRRPDLPGEVPEHAAPGDDPFALDAALTEAWPRLAGRHREVLYLREVLGFSYKEIGAVMGLSLPAVETLVFRARAALRREYERAGGTAFSCGLFGFHLLRVGARPGRNPVLSGSVPGAAAGDPGFSGLSRVAHFISTSLPGCGEQAIAKVLSVAAGVVVAAAAVVPGIGPFGDTAAAAAGKGSGAEVAQAVLASATASTESERPSGDPAPTMLKSWLGNAVPADREPKTSRSDTTAAGEPGRTSAAPSGPLAALREAAKSSDRPSWDRGQWERPQWERPKLRPVRDGSEKGPIRSILPERPRDFERPDRPVQPLRSLLESVPVVIDQVPVEPPRTEPGGESPVAPLPEQDDRPTVRETLQRASESVASPNDTVVSGDGNVADRDDTLLQRRDG